MKYKTRVVYASIEDEAAASIPEACMLKLEAEFEDLGDNITIISVTQCQVNSAYSEHIDGRDYRQRESGILYTIVYKDA